MNLTGEEALDLHNSEFDDKTVMHSGAVTQMTTITFLCIAEKIFAKCKFSTKSSTWKR